MVPFQHTAAPRYCGNSNILARGIVPGTLPGSSRACYSARYWTTAPRALYSTRPACGQGRAVLPFTSSAQQLVQYHAWAQWVVPKHTLYLCVCAAALRNTHGTWPDFCAELVSVVLLDQQDYWAPPWFTHLVQYYVFMTSVICFRVCWHAQYPTDWCIVIVPSIGDSTPTQWYGTS